MNIIETIRKEIERLKETHKGLLEGRFRSGYYAAFRQILDFLDTLPEQPVEGLEEAAEEYIKKGKYLPEAFVVKPAFIAGAEWGASHAVAPHYFKLRELKTGRVFLAEWSDMAGEWYERGNGRAHQSEEVEIVQHAKKK